MKLTVTTDISGTPTQVPVLQPQMGVALTAMLSDGDISYGHHRSPGSGTGAAPKSTAQQMALTQLRVRTPPSRATFGSRLTAKATYMDGEDANNKKMAEALHD